MAPKTSAPSTHYFTCAVVGETITECDTLIKAIVGRKFFASKSTFGCSEGELDAIRDGLKAMSRDGLLGGNDSISSVTLSAEDDPTGATLVDEISAVAKKSTKDGKGVPEKTEPTQKLMGRCAEFRFIHVLDPQQLVSMTPPPSAVIMCYTPVEPATLTALSKKWVPSVAQMLKRPELLVVATRVESLASKKGIEWLKTQGTPKTSCEEAIDKASSWRAVDYVEVSAACYVNIELLLRILAKACFIIPSKRVTPEIAEAMRKDCIQPIVSTQSRWSWKRTDRRRLYFYNRITRSSQWTRPLDYDGEEPEMTEAEKEAEAKAKRNEIEKRMRDDHEKILEEQFRNEAAMHSEKMEEMEKQSVGLSQQVNTLTIQMEEIRRLIAVNKRDREELERLKEGIEETRFSKSSVDDDTRVERSIADARARVFELESRAAMNEEKQNYSIEIAELVLSNDLQAQTLRKLLQSQVDVRKQGAATQSKAAALTAHMDIINGQIASILQEIPKTNHMLSAKQAELRRTRKSLQELQTEKAALSSSIEDSDGLEYNRQVNIEKLIHQSKMLDVEIDKKRLEKGLINMAAAAAGGGLDVTGRFPSPSSPSRHNHASSHNAFETSSRYDGGDLEASQRMPGGRLKTNVAHGSGAKGATPSAHQQQQRTETQKAAESALREEESRLHLEEKSLASQLAIAAAEAALREIALRQKSHLLEYALSEHSFSAEKYLRIFADLVDTLARIRDDVCSGTYFAVSNPFELDMLAATIEDTMADTSLHSAGGYQSSNKKRPATATTSGLGISSPTAASMSTNSILKGVSGGARATTPSGGSNVRPSRTMSSRPSQSSLKKSDSKLGGSFGKNASFGESAVSSGGGGRNNNNAVGDTQQQMAVFTKNDMRLMRSAVGVEKQRGDLAATVRAKCKLVEHSYTSTKSTIETQRMRTLTHMRDALKSMSEIDVLAGHERSSPLDRFVTLLEDSFVGSNSKHSAKRGSATTIASGSQASSSSTHNNSNHDGGELPAIVSDIIDGFTARMLQSVPANERSRLAMQVNSVFVAGSSHLTDLDHHASSSTAVAPTTTSSKTAGGGGANNNINDGGSTRALINNAILTSSQGATKAALYGPGSLRDVESQYRSKEHQTTALTIQYNDAARRAASSLGIDLDGPNANQRDSLARAKMKVFSTPPSQIR